MDHASESTTDERDVALYHVVYAHETFNDAAQALFELVRKAEAQRPGKARRLFLDIEGHPNDKGGFDDDMFELQQNFVPQVLNRFVSEIHSPLCQMKNPDPQNNNIPAELRIEGSDTK